MNNIRRGFLYFIAAFFIVFGMTGLFVPHFINAQLDLMPATIAGVSETRGLYGGGFVGFGLVIICGLRCNRLAGGLLLAMCIIMGGVVVGRLLSLGIDRDLASTLPIALGEFLIALACWVESRNSAKTAKWTL